MVEINPQLALKSTTKIQKVAFYEMVISAENDSRYIANIDDAIEEILNLSPQQIRQDISLMFDLILADDRETVKWYDKEARENSLPFSVQYRTHVAHSDQIKTLQVFSHCHQTDDKGNQFWKGVIVDVTDHVAALLELSEAKALTDKKLSESESRLIDSLEAAEHGVWDWDMVTGEVYYSPIWKSMLGYEVDELGNGLEEFESRIHPDDNSNLWELIQEHIDGFTKGFKAEFRMRSKSGEWMWILAHGRVTRRNEKGLPIRLSGTHTDITVFKQAEFALVRSEENFRQLFEANKLVQLIIDPETGQVLNANLAAVKFYGYSLPQLLALNIFEINTLPKEKLKQEMAKARSQKRDHFFFKHRLASGDVRDVEVHSGPVFYDDRNCIYSIVNDVTDKKHLETELENERALMKALINGIPDLVWMKDRDGVYLAANSRFEEFFGAKSDFILGKTDYDFLPKQEAEFFREHDLKAIKRGGPSANEETITFAKDGHQETLETIRTPIMSPQGELIGVLGVGRDITERKRLERDLRVERNLFAAGPVTVSSFTAADPPVIEFMSQNCSELLGYEAEEFVSGKRKFYDLVHPDDLPLLKKSILDHQQAGTDHWDLSYRVINREKEVVWLYDFIAAEKNEQGETTHFRGYWLDVTQQKEAEAQANKLSMVAQKTINSVVITDAQGYIEWVNEAFTEISEFGLEEVVGRKPGSFLQGKDTDSYTVQFMAKKIAAAEGFITEILNYTKSGEPYWLKIEIQPVFDEYQTLTNFIAIGSNITEEKRIQKELNLASNVFENAHDGILVCDANAKIVDVNPMFEEISGYTKEDVLGHNPKILASGRQTQIFYEDMWVSINKNGFWSGELWNRRKNGELYAIQSNISTIKDDQGHITHYISIFSDISQLKHHQEQLEKLAHYDPLTQLPNRVLLSDRLNQAIAHADRTKTLLAVCFLDLDNFKPVNDTYGHNIGDQLLIELSKKLLQYVRGEDTIARLGGDEFVLLLGDFKYEKDIEQMAAKILAIVSEEIVLSNYKIQLSGSLGVTIYPKDSSDPDRLIRHADQAMYDAKLHGRDRFHIFDTIADKEIYQKQQSLTRIREGLYDGEFELYYQPKINVRDGKLFGFEALVRWNHPETGLIYPNNFIPFIDGHSLSTDLDVWVMENAMMQLSHWNQRQRNLSISINITGDSLLKHSFMTHIKHLLELYPQVRPEQLQVEVLETSTLSDVDTAREHLNLIRSLGVEVALDDFGTGYSSLTYLRNLPADTLKIDRTFIADMLIDKNDRAIVEGIIQLAKVFDLHVIAEGVENIEVATELFKIGCENIQGFWISKPITLEEANLFIDDWQPEKIVSSMKDFS